MGIKIFVSYKYSDVQVEPLSNYAVTKARHYVDELQDALSEADHINKGEDDGESLADFTDEYIASKLRNKIYDSSLTVVLLSRGMKENDKAEKDQWIPWEISYSLRAQTRDGRQSQPNGVLAVVLPDQNGSYAWYFKENHCPHCNSTMLQTGQLFSILKKNMFNAKDKERGTCENHDGGTSYTGDHSYIRSVKWDDFMDNIEEQLKKTIKLRDRINEFNITKQI
jgi:hypothetical protein